MKNSPAPLGSSSLTCPVCETGRLVFLNHASAGCTACGLMIGGSLLKTLLEISSLPNAQGRHACDCGHPEMRRSTDGVYHCPACGEEVLPYDHNATRYTNHPTPESAPRSGAYWSGWLDGRYGTPGSFADNPRLARWEDLPDRLDYYRGHRAGNEARRQYMTRFREAS